MTEISIPLRQNILIDTDTILSNIINGDVTVDNSSVFTIRGMVNGNITVQKGATVVLRGTINGDLINSGHCKIYGMINGQLIEKGGQFEIDPNAAINGKLING